MKTKIIQNIKAIVLGLILAVGVSYAAAGTWTAPVGAPPGNNTDAPINVGGASQTKTGPLTLLHLFTPDLTVTNPDGSVTNIPSGSALVADGDNTGKVKWAAAATVGNTSPSCTYTETGIAETGYKEVSLIANGRNICSDNDGCTYKFWYRDDGHPAGSNFYTSHAPLLKQVADGTWIDSVGDGGASGTDVNGDGVRAYVFTWAGAYFMDDSDSVTLVENSKDKMTLRDSRSDLGYSLAICDN